MKKSKYLTLGLISLTCAAIIAISSVSITTNKLNAAGTTTWKHFSAVMPTKTVQGIREYWTDCIGGKPYFTKPSGIDAKDCTLTDDQINAILANQKDERIIPTLDRIQNAVNKNKQGLDAQDYTFIYDAYGYTYLDETTKTQITGADISKINQAKATWEESYFVVFDTLKDTLPIVEQPGVSLKNSYDSDHGDVLEITTNLGSEGKTSELYFYGLERNNVTYGENDVLNFSVYSPFDAETSTSQTYWIGAYGTAKKVTANPKAWTLITGTGSELNSDKTIKTSLCKAISLQRYVNGTISPYNGTYKMTNIIAKKELTEEGATVIRGMNNISDVHTWKSSGTTDVNITYGVSTKYGTATQVDIKTKTTVLELKWDNVDYSSINKFDYARIYVYAKTTQRLFISLTSWRNNVVSLPGIEPFASNNKTQANAVQGIANVVADQWNIIDIPVSYFKQDTDTSFFIELWDDQNQAKDGWLFTDFYGHYSTKCLTNAGIMVEGFGTPTVSLTNGSDDTYGSYQNVKLLAKQGYLNHREKSDISGFDKLEFDVYNASDSNKQMLLYKLTGTVYGNAVKGSYLVCALSAKQWNHISININEYFGEYAPTSLMMFRFDGNVDDVFYISSLYTKINTSGHTHIYGDLIKAVDPSCTKDGAIAHYHCDSCGKDFDESKKEVDTIVVPATGHHYETVDENYVCSTCGTTISKAEELVIKKEKATKQYVFLGSSICNGYHGPGLECTSMADFFRNDYLLATYTALRSGSQVTETNVYLRRITDNSTTSEPYLGVYSYDFDKIELRTGGVGLFNGKQFAYTFTDGRLLINEPASYLYKFNAVFYGKDNVIKKASNGFSLSDKQPRWATPTQEITDRHSYVGLMEELVSEYSELDVDEFVVQLSTNDMGIYSDQACTQHLPFGEVTSDDVKDITKFVKDTSFGALEWIVAKAKEVWGCRVTIFTCQMYDADYAIYKNNGYDLSSLKTSSYYQMYEPTLKVAKKWGTGLIDIYANKEAEIKLNENKTRYKSDVVHLTEIGYEAVMYQVFKKFYDQD